MDIRQETYFRYWGKADDKYPREPKWHPLAYHCFDVAACGKVLLERHPAWLDTISRLSGLPPQILQEWLVFLLAIHDIGKFAHGFQQKRRNLQLQLQGRETSVGGIERHDTLGYELAMYYLPNWLDHPELAERGAQLLRPWLAAVTGHHGRPPKNLDGTILRNQFDGVFLADAEAFVREVVSLLLLHGYSLPARSTGLVERYKKASWMLAGMAVTADWLGSNTRWFPYQEPTHTLAEYWHDVALPQAAKAVEDSGLNPASTTTFSGIPDLFPGLKGAQPTPLQVWAANSTSAPIAEGPQLFIIEELTGGGKTEAALTLAARLMEAGRGRGVYLALPTMATSDAMFDRVRKDDIWRRFFAENSGAQLALAHSADKLKLELENRRDGGYGKGEELSASLLCSAWLSDSRKKALLADFAVGTLDQALLAVLPIRHQSLRLLGLSGKILIVDEVHACDCYMGELLSRLLEFHAAQGGSAILLSATLPLAQRIRYAEVFAHGAGLNTPNIERTGYPLTTHLSTNGLIELSHAARRESTRKVAIDTLPDEDAVFRRLWSTLQAGGCAVWVRNTIADAVEAWRCWNQEHPGHPATLFHARFALQDRLEIGKEILARFGPDSKPEDRSGKLVIATQVIEQSLDADFDDMVTDLAPIDLIVQRAGRLQRHVRDRRGRRLAEDGAVDGRGGARLGVLMPEPVAEAGKEWIASLLPKTGKVYPDHGKLWLTARWIARRKGFRLPKDARRMIETVYCDKAFNRLPKGLRGIATEADGDCKAGRGLARSNLLIFEQGYNPDSKPWPDDADTPTRLGEDTVRLRLARNVDGVLHPWATTDSALDWALSELTIPKRLIAGESPRDAALIQSAKKSMPDEGRYCLVIAVQEDSKGLWHGYATNLKAEDVRLAYSARSGLTIETGVEDESDL